MNINKLKGKIVENGLNVDEVASQIKMDRSTFYRKMRNAGFTIQEAVKIKDALNLTDNEANTIFFSHEVA
jgi:predicted DNA-binding protein (UPF0251 family)